MSWATSNAKLRTRALVHELARLGIPVDLSVVDMELEDEKVGIEQVGWVHGSHLFELQHGLVACMANIAVTNHTSRIIDVVDVELRAPWDGSHFQWLTPRRVKSQGRGKRESSYLVYEFPGEGGLQLEYREVINHLLLERKRLPVERRLEGWLLGTGGLMPPGLLQGQWHDMRLTIIGADYAEYETTICLWTERLYRRTKIVKPRTRIFEELANDEAMLGRDVTSTAPLSANQPPASNTT